MSTDLSHCSQKFQQEFAALKTDAAQFATDQKAEASARASAIKSAEDAIGKGNPAALLVFLIVDVLGSKTNSYFELQLQTKADAVKMQADITHLSDSIQNTVNSGSTDPNDVKQVAAETDKMQEILAPGTEKDPNEINTALGSASCSLMAQNFAKIRDDINWTGDPNAKTYNKPSSNYHFDADGEGSKHLHTYSQMKEGLSKQGDTAAQDANKILVDNFQQNVSVTQSMGTAANAAIGLITSKIKQNTSFVSDIIQDTLTGNRTAIKNQIAQ